MIIIPLTLTLILIVTVIFGYVLNDTLKDIYDSLIHSANVQRDIFLKQKPVQCFNSKQVDEMRNAWLTGIIKNYMGGTYGLELRFSQARKLYVPTYQMYWNVIPSGPGLSLMTSLPSVMEAMSNQPDSKIQLFVLHPDEKRFYKLEVEKSFARKMILDIDKYVEVNEHTAVK